MFDKISLKLSPEDQEQKERMLAKVKERYRDYQDPWGFNIDAVAKAMDYILPLYRNYFKVRVFGAENVKDEPYMIVSNHTGQLPIDAVLITTAFGFDIDPPRVCHSMIERFMAGLPFLGDLTAQTGSILGDRGNCKWLLKNGESILVFPEGVRGISKSTSHFYETQKFSNGFFRIAVESKSKILPIAVVGAEEMFPFVLQAKKLGRKLGMPSLPLTANFIPLPSPIDIHIGEPYEIPEGLSSEAQDKLIREHVYKIERQVKHQLAVGLKNRRPFFDKIRKPLLERILKSK